MMSTRLRLAADRRFAFAQARAADHLIFRRVVVEVGFDPGAHPLDLFPHGNVRASRWLVSCTSRTVICARSGSSLLTSASNVTEVRPPMVILSTTSRRSTRCGSVPMRYFWCSFNLKTEILTALSALRRRCGARRSGAPAGRSHRPDVLQENDITLICIQALINSIF
jgi:hypothetical protein